MTTFNYRGTTINKVNINDFENEFEDLGLDTMEMWRLMGDGESDFIYVSNGFLRALENVEDVTDGEWHHYFKKDGSDFECYKLNFNDKVSTYVPF